MLNEEHTKVLKKILSDIEDNITVSDSDYESWKVNFERLNEHEKVFQLLGVMSQYLLSGCRASASVFATAVICIDRWCDEKDLEDF